MATEVERKDEESSGGEPAGVGGPYAQVPLRHVRQHDGRPSAGPLSSEAVPHELGAVGGAEPELVSLHALVRGRRRRRLDADREQSAEDESEERVSHSR